MMTTHAGAAELAPHLFKDTLDNGLTVLVKEMPGSKVATVQIWVKAGSIYENRDEAGITHLIEHMIFKGTPSFGPGQLAEEVESLGGRINAYTSFENTVYHATLSAKHWRHALTVLSDAVRHSLFDAAELEREKKVVLEEISMRNDRPAVKMFQTLLEEAYTVHPYRLPVIGTVESVSSFSRDDIVAYMAKHYHPENMMIQVVGDVRFGEVLAAAKEEMGAMEGGAYQRPPLPLEPPHKKPVFFAVNEEVGQNHLALALPASSFNSADTPAFDVMSVILGQGETSRLFRRLRDELGLVHHINAAAFTPLHPGLLEITALLADDKVAEVLEGILVELFSLKYEAVSAKELARAKRNLEGDFTFNLERAEGQARTLGAFEFLSGDPRNDEYLDRVRAVSQEDIMALAQRYFKPEVITAGCLLSLDAKAQVDDFPALIARADTKAQGGVDKALLPDAYLSNSYRYKLANGLTLLVREDDSVDTVAIRAIFPGGLRAESQDTNGAFAFISDLFPRTTAELSAPELAVQVADMAGSLSGFNGKNTFGLKADFLGRYFQQGLTLVRDVIVTPGFDPQEAEKIRPELLAQLKRQEDSLPSLAFREFNRLLFEGHPYGLNTMGARGPLSTMKVADLRAIYERQARPEEMVLTVAGAVQAAEVRELVGQLFADWGGGGADGEEAMEESFLPPELPAKPVTFNLARQKEQVHIIIGFQGTTLSGTDRYGLEVLEKVLSGQSGRLFTELRDKNSMAYSLSAFSHVGIDTGSFGIYIGTNPEKKEAVIKALWQELTRIMNEPVSEKELARAKNVLISAHDLHLQTHGEQAMDMALNEVYDLGQDYGQRYIEELAKVDGARLMAVAKKYILADHHVMVTVGGNGGR
ncbi:MAG: pitrilysin family protein [Thermodesulfobacteriota bacterium]